MAQELPTAAADVPVGSKIPVHVSFGTNDKMIEISETSARFLYSVLDRITLSGHDAKFAAGVAQMELAKALVGPAEEAPPRNRAEKRAREKAGAGRENGGHAH